MKKRYLKNIEDVEALRNTDTKIYCENIKHWYCQFIEGVLCRFFDDKNIVYNASMELNGNYYIEVEDEPSENDIGKLGWFWDDYDCEAILDWLIQVRESEVFPYVSQGCRVYYKHFRPLTSEEVEKYTGYKVVKEEV